MKLINHIKSMNKLTYTTNDSKLSAKAKQILSKLPLSVRTQISGVRTQYNKFIDKRDEEKIEYSTLISGINTNNEILSTHYLNKYQTSITGENKGLNNWIVSAYTTNNSIRLKLDAQASIFQTRLVDFLNIYHNWYNIFNRDYYTNKYEKDVFMPLSALRLNSFPINTVANGYSNDTNSITWKAGNWLSTVISKSQYVIDYSGESAIKLAGTLETQVNNYTVNVPVSMLINANKTIYTGVSGTLYNKYKSFLSIRNDIISNNYVRLKKNQYLATLTNNYITTNKTNMVTYNNNINNKYYGVGSNYMLSADMASIADDYQYQVNNNWPWCSIISNKWKNYRKNGFPKVEGGGYGQLFYLTYSFTDLQFI